MAKWSVSPSTNVSINQENNQIKFPKNTGNTDIEYTITYEDDYGCIEKTTYIIPSGSTCCNLGGITAEFVKCYTNSDGKTCATIKWKVTNYCEGVSVITRLNDGDANNHGFTLSNNRLEYEVDYCGSVTLGEHKLTFNYPSMGTTSGTTTVNYTSDCSCKLTVGVTGHTTQFTAYIKNSKEEITIDGNDLITNGYKLAALPTTVTLTTNTGFNFTDDAFSKMENTKTYVIKDCSEGYISGLNISKAINVYFKPYSNSSYEDKKYISYECIESLNLNYTATISVSCSNTSNGTEGQPKEINIRLNQGTTGKSDESNSIDCSNTNSILLCKGIRTDDTGYSRGYLFESAKYKHYYLKCW